MFGLGGFEIVIILIFAFLIFGPDRLPAIARTIGNFIARFRDTTQNVTSTLQTEVFDKNSDQPFKNPLNAIDKIADNAQQSRSQNNSSSSSSSSIVSSALNAVTAAATGGSTAAAAKATEDQASHAEHVESFAERKARYEKERIEKKEAEKKAAQEGAAAETEPADPITKTPDKDVSEASNQTKPDASDKDASEKDASDKEKTTPVAKSESSSQNTDDAAKKQTVKEGA